MNLTEAKAQVELMLGIAGGDPDRVKRAIDQSQENTRTVVMARVCANQSREAFETSEGDYALLREALADITGDAVYGK